MGRTRKIPQKKDLQTIEYYGHANRRLRAELLKKKNHTCIKGCGDTGTRISAAWRTIKVIKRSNK